MAIIGASNDRRKFGNRQSIDLMTALFPAGQPLKLKELCRLLQIVPPEFVAQAIPGGQLAPHLAKRGIEARRVPAADVYYQVFNMEHPVVGGLAPERVALRRAIGMGYDIDREITLVRRGEAIAAQGMTVPGTFGYDAALRTPATRHDLSRARALLDRHHIPYRYVDINQDEAAAQFVESVNRGFRSVPTIVWPDGSMLVEPSTSELAKKLGVTQP